MPTNHAITVAVTQPTVATTVNHSAIPIFALEHVAPKVNADRSVTLKISKTSSASVIAGRNQTKLLTTSKTASVTLGAPRFIHARSLPASVTVHSALHVMYNLIKFVSQRENVSVRTMRELVQTMNPSVSTPIVVFSTKINLLSISQDASVKLTASKDLQRLLSVAHTTDIAMVFNAHKTPFGARQSVRPVLQLLATPQPLHQMETLSVHVFINFKKPFKLSEPTDAAFTSNPIIVPQVDQDITIEVDKAVALDFRIHVLGHPVVNRAMTLRPITTTQVTNPMVLRQALKVLSIEQSPDVVLGPYNVARSIFVIERPVLNVDATEIIRRLVPIMGQIYQPTDEIGALVPVVANLFDYYYWFNTDDVPSVFWAPSDLSRNTINDRYRFWRTK